jgi:hypothetical protein
MEPRGDAFDTLPVFRHFGDLKLPGLPAFLGRQAAGMLGERISQVWGGVQFFVYIFIFWNFIAYCENPTSRLSSIEPRT